MKHVAIPASVLAVFFGCLAHGQATSEPATQPASDAERIGKIIESLPAEYRKSPTETAARASARESWLNLHLKELTLSLTGKIKSMTPRRRIEKNAPEMIAELEIPPIIVWGSPVPTALRATLEGVRAEDAAKWNVGDSLTISGIAVVSYSPKEIEILIEKGYIGDMPDSTPKPMTPDLQRLATYLDSIPKNYWASTPRGDYAKWLRDHPMTASITVDGLIRRPYGGTSIVIDVGKMQYWGKSHPTTISATLTNVPAADVAAWKDGDDITVQGVPSISLMDGVTIRLPKAVATKHNFTPIETLPPPPPRVNPPPGRLIPPRTRTR